MKGDEGKGRGEGKREREGDFWDRLVFASWSSGRVGMHVIGF